MRSFSIPGFFTPFVFITDRAMLIGVDINSATFLLSISGHHKYLWEDCEWVDVRQVVGGLSIRQQRIL